MQNDSATPAPARGTAEERPQAKLLALFTALKSVWVELGRQTEGNSSFQLYVSEVCAVLLTVGEVGEAMEEVVEATLGVAHLTNP